MPSRCAKKPNQDGRAGTRRCLRLIRCHAVEKGKGIGDGQKIAGAGLNRVVTKHGGRAAPRLPFATIRQQSPRAFMETGRRRFVKKLSAGVVAVLGYGVAPTHAIGSAGPWLG